MSEKNWGQAAALAGLLAAYFLLVGAQMWSEPPTPAEEAVGKGLVAIGGGVAIVGLVSLCAYLNARNAPLGPVGDQPE